MYKKAQVTLSNFVCVSFLELMHIIHIHSLKFEGSRIYIYIYISPIIPSERQVKSKCEITIKTRILSREYKIWTQRPWFCLRTLNIRCVEANQNNVWRVGGGEVGLNFTMVPTFTQRIVKMSEWVSSQFIHFL